MSAASGVQAVAVHKGEALLFFTLLQLVVIVLAGRIGATSHAESGNRRQWANHCRDHARTVAVRCAEPACVGYVFHSAPPEAMQILSQIGLILLMFRSDWNSTSRISPENNNRRAVFAIAAASLVAPFVLGAAFGAWSAPTLSPGADPFASALFIATAFSITALPVLGRIMIEFNMTRVPLGVIAISAAAISTTWLAGCCSRSSR